MAEKRTFDEIDTREVAIELDPGMQRQTAKLGTLTVLSGRDVGAFYAMTSQAMLIGRSANAHLRLEDEGVSRNHARVVRSGEQYLLEDLGSTNGTYLGDKSIRGREQLHDNARIRIGNALLRFTLQDQIELDAARCVYEASVRDGLTGTFNRRHFEDRLAAELSFAMRQGTPVCALLLDVDHFKRVNDTLGHPAGDEVLRRIGKLLLQAARSEDLVARYGGEEFAIIARGIGTTDGVAFAERLRALIERSPIEWQGKRVPITVSIGVAHNRAGVALSTSEQLVAAADRALYAAKEAGRNRVELAVSPGRYAVLPAVDEGDEPVAKVKRRAWETSTFPLDDGSKPAKPPPPPPRKKKHDP